MPPNIILFVVDDMGLMDTSVPFLVDGNDDPINYDLNKLYRTPNMERLASQGIRFTNFYAHSVCSPTRTSIITGQNSARHGVTNWIKSENNNKSKFGPPNWNWTGLSKKSVTLPRLLKNKGYKTIHVGKAHYGPFESEAENPINLGFDVNIAGSSIGQPGSYLGTEGFGHIARNKKRAVPGLEKYHGQEIFLTEVLTLEAQEAISSAHQQKKPFFLNMSHYAVHSPFIVDSRFIKNYENLNFSDKAKAFATLIEGIDKSLGDIMNHVIELGIGENTIILFVGDNGSDAPLPIENNYSSAFPLKGKKGTHWEGGMRVPFITSWIKADKKNENQRKTLIAQNTLQQQLGTVMDIFPTICKIANIDYPKDYTIDGFELQRQLRGEKNTQRREEFLNHFPHQHRSSYFTSFVHNDWKIVYHYQIENLPKYELFHLKTDPFEKKNLATMNINQLQIMMKLLQNELQNKKALYPEKDNKPLKLVYPR